MTPRRFFDALYEGASGWITIWTLPDRRTQWLQYPRDLHATGALGPVLRSTAGSHAFFGVGLRRDLLTGGRRGGTDDVSYLPGLWIEIDTHKHEADKGDVLDRLLALDYAPQIVVDSGGGLHAYWLCAPFAPPPGFGAEVVRPWQLRVGDALGLPVDAVQDPARVLRLPGSVNRKPEYGPDGRRVEIVHWSVDERYGLADLEREARAYASVRPAAPVGPPPDLGDLSGGGRDPAAVRDALSSISADCVYDTWIGIGFALRSEFGAEGLPIWREWSRTAADRYPGDDAIESHWRSLPDESAWSVATVYYHARLAGWKRTTPEWASAFLERVIENGRAREPEHYHAGTTQHAADLLAYTLRGRFLYAGGRGWHALSAGIWQRLESPEAVLGSEATRAAYARAFDLQRELDTHDPEADELAYRRLETETEAWFAGAKNLANSDRPIQRAQGLPLISCDAGDLDTHPHLLAAPNGVIDLRTGELRPHDPRLRLTRSTPTAYLPGAAAPTWRRFLLEICSGDAELVGFLQRWCGYSATGSNVEQVFAILQGEGANGKTTFVEAIAQVLGGGFVSRMPSEHLRKMRSTHEAYVARLAGSRLAIASETSEGLEIDDALIKQLTGGEPITARHLYGQPFEFTPEFKIWLVVNPLPVFAEGDFAIWRRVLLVQFRERFDRADPRRDEHLPAKLAAEAEGILRWIVEGAVHWHERGLQIPDSVRLSTEQYRRDSNPAEQWIDEFVQSDPEHDLPAAAAYKSFLQWCEASDFDPCSRKKFGSAVEKNFPKVRKNFGFVYRGAKIAIGAGNR